MLFRRLQTPWIRRYRAALLTLALLLAVAAGCRITDLPLWGPADRASACEVEKHERIRYCRREGGDARDNELDVYAPKCKRDCPVVVFVHGGAWLVGDNRCCGLYSSVGEFLASRGMVAVLPNYRLSPEVKHPAHIQDVAHAVAWAHEHAAEYGGRSDELFLVGHSAGGHLVALLATDEKYLRDVGLGTRDIRGVVAVSGVYNISRRGVALTLGGPTAEAFGPDKVLPLRGPNHPGKFRLPGVPLQLDIFLPAFGSDPQVRADASPINHVRPGLPPFLLVYADNDLPTLRELAREFHEALLRHDCSSQLLMIAERNHHSVIFDAIAPSDPVANHMLRFIAEHVSGPAAPSAAEEPVVPDVPPQP